MRQQRTALRAEAEKNEGMLKVREQRLSNMDTKRSPHMMEPKLGHVGNTSCRAKKQGKRVSEMQRMSHAFDGFNNKIK